MLRRLNRVDEYPGRSGRREGREAPKMLNCWRTSIPGFSVLTYIKVYSK